LNVVDAVGNETKADLKAYSLPPAKGQVKMIDADNVGELVKLLKNEAKVL
jgi:electron transfer flavoprotein beta subunit